MRVLPVVYRELLVLARRSSTYWYRAGAVGAVLLIFFAILQNPIPNAFLGRTLFGGLVVALSFLLPLFGILRAADCISEERRNGTLGLLFLTDLHSYDVILGKLSSRLFEGFQLIFAATPILAMTLMFGGIPLKNIVIAFFILISLLVLSFSISILVSTVTVSAIQAMTASTFSLLLICIVPFILLFVLYSFNLLPESSVCYFLLLGCSPFTSISFVVSLSSPPRLSGISLSTFYIFSIGIMWVYSFLAILFSLWTIRFACQEAPIPQQERPRSVFWQSLWKRIKYIFPTSRPASPTFRRRILDRSALAWILFRRPWTPYLITLRILIIPLGIALWRLFFMWFAPEKLYWDWEDALPYMSYFAHLSLKFSFIFASIRHWVELPNHQVMELLLISPLQRRDWISGQYYGLFRLYLPALLVVLLLLDFPLYFSISGFEAEDEKTLWFFHVSSLILDLLAIAALGLWLGAKSKSTIGGVLGICWRIFLPWPIFFFSIPFLARGVEENLLTYVLILKWFNALFWLMVGLSRIQDLDQLLAEGKGGLSVLKGQESVLCKG